MDVDNIPYIYYFLLLDMDKESVIHMILFRSLLTLSYQLIYNCHIVLLLHHVCWTVTPRDMSHDRPSVAMTTENLIHILSVMLNWCIVKRHSITLSLYRHRKWPTRLYQNWWYGSLYANAPKSQISPSLALRLQYVL